VGIQLGFLLMQLLDNKRLTRGGGVKYDKWIWRDVDNMDFSVKAAYKCLMGEMFVRMDGFKLEGG